MESSQPWESGALGFILYIIMIIGIISTMLAAAAWFGEKRRTKYKNISYECGMEPSGNARLKIPIRYYLVAIFFLIFDVESVFIYQWAVVAKALGVWGLVWITFFILVLLLSLFYVWAEGGLDWEKKSQLYIKK